MLSSVFSYIRSKFLSLAYYFSYIGNWLEDQGWPWSSLAPYFYSVRDLCQHIGGFFYDAYQAARTVESLLDDAWTKAKQAFDYAYDVLTDKVNDALSAAGDAWDYAGEAYDRAWRAWDYARGWLRDKVYEALAAAGNVWGSVTDWLKDKAIDAYNKAVWAFDQIGLAVTAAAQDFYAWVKAIPAEISAFVDGVVADIGAVMTDIAQTLINNALASIAGSINLVNFLFDDIQAFFTSPLDWLGSKFTDWFLGPEQ